MARALLTVDVALDLLDEYAEEEAVAIDLVGDDATDVAALSLAHDQPRNAKENRFKRARETKKNELVYLRTQASGLERVLRLLKQQQRCRLTNSRPSVWQVTALRQEEERREAELLNARLRAMVQATAKRARQLKCLLSVPDTLSDLVHHKRLSQQDVASFEVDAIEVQSVILAVDLLEIQVAATLSRLDQDKSGALVLRRDGCRLVVELVDSSRLPYSVSSVGTSAWHLLAVGDAASTPSTQESGGDASGQVTRLYTMQLITDGLSITYRGVYVYRKRIDAAGQLVISWTSSWTRLDLPDSLEEGHESFRREGFVVVSPSSGDDGCASCVRVFHRVERDACGAHSCNKGAWGYATAKDAEENVAGCVASEIKTFFQALENQIVMRGAQDQSLTKAQE